MKTIVVLTALLCMAVFCGCTDDSKDGDDIDTSMPDFKNPEGFLSAELERRILQDYVDGGGVGASRISGYCGTYNGWVVVKVDFPNAQVIPTVTIGGYNFDNLPPIIAWKDGQIYELKDAYAAGLLTYYNLRTISTMSGLGEFEGLGLSAELEWQILLDFAKVDVQDLAEVDVFWGSVIGYYGAYNGWVVVRMGGGIYHHGGPELVTIGGFNFDVSKPIIVWKDGQIYELRDAYDAGLLTQDDVGSIAKCPPHRYLNNF